MPDASHRNIKVADGNTSATRGFIKNVPVSFAGKSTELEFLVVEEMPVDLITGSPTLGRLEVDRKHNYVTINIDKSEVQLGFEYERTREQNFLPEVVQSEDFSSGENYDDERTSSDDEEAQEGYVVMLRKDIGGKRPKLDKEDEIARKVGKRKGDCR